LIETFLPTSIAQAIKKVPFSHLYEVRIRQNRPVLVNVKGQLYYIENNCITPKVNSPLIATKQTIESILFKVTNGSMYAYTEQMKQGFLTIAGGIRIGLVGEVVSENNSVISVKHISSLNIRIPHEVIGCSSPIFESLVHNGTLYNTLIISPPGAGKTTLLRDLARATSEYFPQQNVLILDERYEISATVEGQAQLNVGQADVLLGGTKQMGFENGIRSMSPHLIFTDEIATKQDIASIVYASGCGVRVVATVHAASQQDLLQKPHFKKLLQKKVFTRFVVLSSRTEVGKIEGVYDEQMQCVKKEFTYATYP
jgi:stage III sporulation protein AA